MRTTRLSGAGNHAGVARLILTGAAVALALAGVLVGPSVSRANSPCHTAKRIPLTGALIELRQGDQVVGADQQALDLVPRFVCARPVTAAEVEVADCWFPDRQVTATLGVGP